MWKEVLLGAVLLGGGPAGAATMQAVIIGTVGTVQDVNDAFLGGDVVEGMPFTATYTYDTGVAEPRYFGTPGGPESLSLDYSFGTPDFMSATFEVADYVFDIAGDLDTLVHSNEVSEPSFTYDFHYYFVGSDFFGPDLFAFQGLESTLNTSFGELPFGLEEEFTQTFDPDDPAHQYESIVFQDLSCPSTFTDVSECDHFTTLNLLAQSLTVTKLDEPAPVPLPASGMLLLATLGAFGFAGLRRGPRQA